MLQSFPPYTMHSAMHFQDSGYFPAKVASDKKARPKKSTHVVESRGEEEDYVFV